MGFEHRDSLAVSHVPFFKLVDPPLARLVFLLKRSVPFAVVILIVLFIVLISYQPSVVPFACFVVYAISGFIWSGWLALKRRRS